MNYCILFQQSKGAAVLKYLQRTHNILSITSEEGHWAVLLYFQQPLNVKKPQKFKHQLVNEEIENPLLLGTGILNVTWELCLIENNPSNVLWQPGVYLQ